jgi:ribonuclease E
MSKKMLVDASHPEETRVVVLNGNRVEEFDYENAERLQLKGNIYLAKVTRVEPSLQACFVEYGGNRHGFLPFSEIHPDYYRIPKEDRVALMEAERAEQRARALDDDDDEDEQETSAVADTPVDARHDEPAAGDEGDAAAQSQGDGTSSIANGHDTDATEPSGEAGQVGDADDAAADAPETPAEANGELVSVETAMPAEDIETIGSEDALEEVPTRKPRHMRRYKIQEVIARKQILLIQVVKEERGSKGAALTTFLSLAGRYCVLMPNTDRGGGISRKIANPADRRKLKELAHDLDVPDGMGLIIRTAGANRTKQEIKRDFEYLLREWDAVRELTLKSTAPTLVYEEGSLIKRAIRDLFNKDVDQIMVEGEAGFDEARDFMRLIMPSHVDMVEKFAQPLPLYQAYGVEAQLDSMFHPTVRLRSGGYIVINQTEALVAVDVNSGKATREHNIEDTALKTNLEAADEVARQLRLRDLAGLIVIDFIDMEEGRNNRHVEKRLKDALKWDRARIQVGRISPFGLLEMSRQRLRSGMVEGSTVQCPHCEGRGFIRSVGSMALRVLRAVEEHCQRQKESAITLRLPPEIAIYILNHKRGQLSGIEDRYGVYIYVESKPSLTASSYEIERGAPVMPEPRRLRKVSAVSLGTVFEEYPLENEPVLEEEDDDAETVGGEASGEENQQRAGANDERQGRRRRRRRGRGQRDGQDGRDASPPREPREQSPRPQPAPRAVAPERPFGVPSPAEFNFGHHDLPDTSPDAIDGDDEAEAVDDTTDGMDDADAAAAQTGGAQSQAERDGERRRRRGRRGRRGRGRDRDAPRANGASHENGAGPVGAPPVRRETPVVESRILAETPHAEGFTHPSLIRPEPQFSIAPTGEQPQAAAARVEPAPPPPKPEARSEWRLSSLFGFGSRETVRAPAPEPVAPPASPPPGPVQAAPEPQPTAASAPEPALIEPVAPEPVAAEPEGPKRGGWWQKRG